MQCQSVCMCVRYKPTLGGTWRGVRWEPKKSERHSVASDQPSYTGMKKEQIARKQLAQCHLA